MQETFSQKVCRLVRAIPQGETRTYAYIAKHAGSPRAVRAVGNILHKNYDVSIPCHRVIRSDGKLGGYNRGTQKKKELLLKEKAI